ncbi:MAG: hypothetical protein ACYC7L_06830 [Nitrospirota bacterium]
MNVTLRLAMLCLCAVFIAPVLPAAPVYSAETQNVHVDNFPETQQIKGSVSIDGPVSHVQFIKKEALLVPPARRAEASEMTYAGTVSAEGFTSITLSLQGEVKSGSAGTGVIGVVLIPDEGPILRAFREAKLVQYAIECVCKLKSVDPIYFSGEQVQQRLSFPRYHIYLYNTTGKTVEANLYMTLAQ